MTLREIYVESEERGWIDGYCSDKQSEIADKVWNTEIVPRKLVEDALSMYELWKKNTDCSMSQINKATDTATYAMYDGWHNGVRDCINYLKGLLAELEGEKDDKTRI